MIFFIYNANQLLNLGDPNPQSAIPKIGFISGTKGNDDCLCLPNGADTSEEICPVRSTRPIYPWKKKGTRNRDKSGNDGTFRFDYDDYEAEQHCSHCGSRFEISEYEKQDIHIESVKEHWVYCMHCDEDTQLKLK